MINKYYKLPFDDYILVPDPAQTIHSFGILKMAEWQIWSITYNGFKVILCAYEHIFLIVRYRYISFTQL